MTRSTILLLALALSCAAALAGAGAGAAPAGAGAGAAPCTFQPHTDYDNGSGGTNAPAASAADCCAQCAAAGAAACWAAVFDLDTGGVCWFKTQAQTSSPSFQAANVSGCWPAGRTPPPQPTPPPPPPPPPYNVTLVSLPPDPVISFLPPLANTAWPQSFNPAFVEPSAGTGGKRGLLVRSQNCSGVAPGKCIGCNVGPSWPIAPYFPGSVLTFALQRADGTFAPPYLVFAPEPGAVPGEDYGTEDPRLAYESSTGTYHLMYTCYSSKEGGNLCHATTADPTAPYPGSWTRLGRVFPGIPSGTKSGALLIRPQGPPHYLYWGDSHIHLAVSSNLVNFTNINDNFIVPRSGNFDDALVEAGPRPMPLSDGNYIFFFNSNHLAPYSYHPEFAILNGTDPTQILQRASNFLLAPTRAWEIGAAPAACNVGNVVFLEAVAAVDGMPDTFDVWFGGSDAVVGTARFAVARNS
jgi:predicted GH43/DUF377 family glycosyl hydrolase